MIDQDAYDELQCYTLAHADPSFIHQHLVDAFTVQHADERTKPIALTFAPVGRRFVNATRLLLTWSCSRRNSRSARRFCAFEVTLRGRMPRPAEESPALLRSSCGYLVR
jgi:hypothetical protein